MRRSLRLILVWLMATTSCAAAPTEATAGDRTPAGAKPNVILIVIDTLRADHLGCYGYGRPTSPRIDRLAAESVVFERAFSPAAWTLPALASAFTGLLPSAHDCVRHDSTLSPKVRSFVEDLKVSGYFCGAIVSNPFLNGKYGFARGFDRYDDYSVLLEAELASLAAVQKDQPPALSEVVTGEAVARQARKLIAVAESTEKPYFLFIHFYDPHDSYIPPAPHDRAFGTSYDGPVNGRGLVALRERPPLGRDRQRLIDLYDGEIAFTDEQVGKVLDALQATKNPGGNLIILTSDHGEALGERGLLLHGNTAYAEETRVPLVWHWRGRLQPGRRSAPASTLDLSMTLWDLLSIPPRDGVQGRSLLPILNGEPTSDLHAVLSETAFELRPGIPSVRHVALTRGSLRLHARFSGQSPVEARTKFELYDLSHDPAEKVDLYPRRLPETEALKSDLVRIWQQSLDLRKNWPADEARPVQLSPRERRWLQGLGYTDTGKGQ